MCITFDFSGKPNLHRKESFAANACAKNISRRGYLWDSGYIILICLFTYIYTFTICTPAEFIDKRDS